MLTAEGPRVLEYNVRFGDPEAQALLARLDCDLFELLDATARGGLDPEAVAVRGGAAVTVVLAAEGYPERPRTGDPLPGLDRAAAVSGVQVHHGGTAWRDGALVTAGGRVLSLTGRGEDLAAAAQAAYRAVDAVAWPGMQVRRDLGAGLAVAPGGEG
jgi:phosphoribosylamine--glycine ligase